MRFLIFALATVSLATAACDRKPAAEGGVATDQVAATTGETADDPTSIDAATGDSRNMAADSNIEQPDDSTLNDSASSSTRSHARSGGTPSTANNSTDLNSD